MQPLRQHARDVFEEPAASDVGERVDAPAADDGQQRLHIDARRLQQRVDEQPALLERRRAVELPALVGRERSEEHTSELQSLMRTSYAVFCLKTNNKRTHQII